MVTRKIGFGMVVSTSDSARTHVAASAQHAWAMPHEFFTAHDMSPPSALFDAVPATFYFAKDVDGRFVWPNRLLQQQHPLMDANTIIGKSDHDFLRCDIADQIRTDDLAVMSGKTSVDNKLEVIGGKGGTLSWLRTTKTPLRNKRGEVVGVEGVSRDVLRVQPRIAPCPALEIAIEYLREHFHEGVSLSQLARISNTPLSTFERKFRQHFSVTPMQYQRMVSAITGALPTYPPSK